MLNNVVIVGRLTRDPEIITNENGVKRSFIIVAVPRIFKNADGRYDSDFIKCILWNIVAEHTCEYCKKGDIVGIKGRIQSNTYEKDGITKYDSEVVVERITFLSDSRNHMGETISETEE